MKIKLNVHSFVDVITNSSTEIYIQVGQHTVDFLKRIVDGILKVAKSELTADEMFIFDISDEEENYNGMSDSYLTVTPKEGMSDDVRKIADDITNNLRGIFYVDGCYNG